MAGLRRTTCWSSGSASAVPLLTALRYLQCRERLRLVHKTSIGCDLYKFSSISSARNPSQEDNGGDKIAFKTMLSTDTCPVAPFDNSSTYSYQNGDRFVYSITTTYSEDSNNDNIISFNYTTLQCPIGSKIFARESLWVCLSVQYFTNELPYQYCANHSRASVLCKNSGGTLTGPANTAEYNYFKNVSVSTSEIAPYSSSVVCIWLDGNSINVTREFVMEDSTHNGDTAYPFSSPNPNSDAPGSCLYFSSFPNPVVDDYLFNSITSARIPNPPYREEKIAFKTTLSTDTCHVNPFVELSGYAYQDSNLVIYKTTITYSVDSNTDKITTFQYEKLECPVESKAFQRGKITVCLSVRFFTNESPYPYCGNHSRASELCKRNGGTLTGPLNIGELEYFKQEILPGISPFDNGTARVWLDGNSINVGREFVMEDSTHEGDKNYPYGFDDPDSVNPGYCLYLYYFPEPFIVDDDKYSTGHKECDNWFLDDNFLKS
uniref:Uncharacterized protein n=1 Tax=Caenorhabditis japonica TaxID=281687 RepID=A0A8R1ESE5_CAEJA